jgi:hypothetical protein
LQRASRICWARITEVTAIIGATGAVPQRRRHWRPASSMGSKSNGLGTIRASLPRQPDRPAAGHPAQPSSGSIRSITGQFALLR